MGDKSKGRGAVFLWKDSEMHLSGHIWCGADGLSAYLDAEFELSLGQSGWDGAAGLSSPLLEVFERVNEGLKPKGKDDVRKGSKW